MARNYITGSRTRKEERLFWSDHDGDSHNRQTVYREHKGGGGSSQVKTKYDPDKGKFGR